MSISERIKQARELRGFSRYELGRIAGLSRATVGAIEGREAAGSGIQARTLLALAAALDVRPAWLLTGEGDAPTATDTPDDGAIPAT